MPQMVYTTEEVEEIVTEYEVKVKNYEDKLHRLKADKRKVEMEKEMLELKIPKLQKSQEDDDIESREEQCSTT